MWVSSMGVFMSILLLWFSEHCCCFDLLQKWEMPFQTVKEVCMNGWATLTFTTGH